MSAPRRKQARRKLGPMLECLIEALDAHDTDDRSGTASALRALGHLAALEIPHRGAFAPDHPDLYSAIEQIAEQHLGFTEPRKAFSESTMEIEDRELRDRIQSNANHMQAISDQAYFYAGLAFGVTFARLGWPW